MIRSKIFMCRDKRLNTTNNYSGRYTENSAR